MTSSGLQNEHETLSYAIQGGCMLLKRTELVQNKTKRENRNVELAQQQAGKGLRVESSYILPGCYIEQLP